MIWTVALDVLLCVLLAIAVGGGLVLHKRLTALRSGHEELRALIQQLNEAAERAQASVVQLRAAAHEAEGHLSERTSRARALADELHILTETSESVALRLERAAGTVLSQRVETAPRAEPKSRSVETVPSPSVAKEAAMLKLLKGVR
jgi:chromosome segregation ATPase